MEGGGRTRPSGRAHHCSEPPLSPWQMTTMPIPTRMCFSASRRALSQVRLWGPGSGVASVRGGWHLKPPLPKGITFLEA